jgi:hypothetical protein
MYTCQSEHRGRASSVKLNFFAGFRSILFRSELRNGLFRGRNSECLGMSTFFSGITEIVPSLFRGIFSERNSVPNPIYSMKHCQVS